MHNQPQSRIQINSQVIFHDIGTSGEGIGRMGSLTVFVPGAIPGDQATIQITSEKKNYAQGKIIALTKPSPKRTEPFCPLFGRCGGCQLQHLSYPAQLEWKTNKVRECFKRIGKIQPTVHPAIGMVNPLAYRNKGQFPVGKDNGSLVTGFYALGTHQIIDTNHCPIQHANINNLLPVIKKVLNQYKILPYHEDSHRGLLRHILIRTGFHSGQTQLCFVINGHALPHHAEICRELIKAIPQLESISININNRQGNAILGPELKLLCGKPYIEDKIQDLIFRISPLSFYQINPVQTELLYAKALTMAQIHRQDTVWDIYCGIGTMTLLLAKQARNVYGLEDVPAAIEDAIINARVNKIKNVRFYCGKAEYHLNKLFREHPRADVVVVDPPRQGCAPQGLKTICAMAPRRIVYVSCDPATLARDVGILVEKGFKVGEVQPVDMFPHTVHIETVTVLTR